MSTKALPSVSLPSQLWLTRAKSQSTHGASLLTCQRRNRYNRNWLSIASVNASAQFGPGVTLWGSEPSTSSSSKGTPNSSSTSSSLRPCSYESNLWKQGSRLALSRHTGEVCYRRLPGTAGGRRQLKQPCCTRVWVRRIARPSSQSP